MVYVPEVNANNNYCVINDTTIVELPTNFQVGTIYNAKHIATNNHYQTWYQDYEVTSSTTCLQNNELTDYWLYRNDLVDILFIFIFFMLIIVYLPYRFLCRFLRWLR